MAKSVSNFNIFSDDSESIGSLADRLFQAFWFIGLGVLLLLNSLGILPWSIWVSMLIILAKWWPLFIIGAGISIILEGSKVGKIISNMIWFVGLLVLFISAVRANPDLNINLDVNSEDFPESIIETVIEQAK